MGLGTPAMPAHARGPGHGAAFPSGRRLWDQGDQELCLWDIDFKLVIKTQENLR